MHYAIVRHVEYQLN